VPAGGRGTPLLVAATAVAAAATLAAQRVVVVTLVALDVGVVIGVGTAGRLRPVRGAEALGPALRRLVVAVVRPGGGGLEVVGPLVAGRVVAVTVADAHPGARAGLLAGVVGVLARADRAGHPPGGAVRTSTVAGVVGGGLGAALGRGGAVPGRLVGVGAGRCGSLLTAGGGDDRLDQVRLAEALVSPHLKVGGDVLQLGERLASEDAAIHAHS